MNLLFVCSRNQWRSPTAEAIFKNHPVYNARSAGTASNARIRVNPKLLEWADIIFAMEYHHKERLKDQFRKELQGVKIIVLEIADDYEYMNLDLITLLTEKLSAYLEEL